MKFGFAQAALLAITTSFGATVGSGAAHGQIIRSYPVASQLQEGSKLRGVVITAKHGNVGSMIIGHGGNDYEVFVRDRNARSDEPMLRIVKMTSDRGPVPIGPGKLFNEVVKTATRIIETNAYDNTGGHSIVAMLRSLRNYGVPAVAQMREDRAPVYMRDVRAELAMRAKDTEKKYERRRVICIAPCFERPPTF